MHTSRNSYRSRNPLRADRRARADCCRTIRVGEGGALNYETTLSVSVVRARDPADGTRGSGLDDHRGSGMDHARRPSSDRSYEKPTRFGRTRRRWVSRSQTRPARVWLRARHKSWSTSDRRQLSPGNTTRPVHTCGGGGRRVHRVFHPASEKTRLFFCGRSKHRHKRQFFIR